MSKTKNWVERLDVPVSLGIDVKERLSLLMEHGQSSAIMPVFAWEFVARSDSSLKLQIVAARRKHAAWIRHYMQGYVDAKLAPPS